MGEPWLDNVEELMADAVELTTNIEDATRFLETAMSFLRNRLLKLELTAMVITLALTFGALVSGIFGMNLKSGHEDEDGWFYWVVIGIVICSIVIMVASYMFYGASKWAAAAHGAVYENNIFCQGVGDDGYILELGSTFSPEHGTLPQTVLERIIRDSKTPASTFPQPTRQLSRLEVGGLRTRSPVAGPSLANVDNARPLLSPTNSSL